MLCSITRGRAKARLLAEFWLVGPRMENRRGEAKKRGEGGIHSGCRGQACLFQMKYEKKMKTRKFLSLTKGVFSVNWKRSVKQRKRVATQNSVVRYVLFIIIISKTYLFLSGREVPCILYIHGSHVLCLPLYWWRVLIVSV